MPDSDSGKYTWRKACIGVAPRLAAACIRSRSILRIEPYSGNTRKGSMICAMPISVPVMLWTSLMGVSHSPT